jgi:protein involved in polysaccharide export with SLBB domain
MLVSPLRGWSLASLILLLAACASAPSHRLVRSDDHRPTYGTWSQDDYAYRIGPGDELSLQFLVNPDLDAKVIVGPDGRGTFPLISGFHVEGMTVEQANDALTREYGAALRRPDVQTLITSYGAAQIYVGGEVHTAGVYPIKGELTPAQAVIVAGGFLPSARTGKVVVIRQRPGDRQFLRRVLDEKDLLERGRSDGGFAILPGDLVFVPRSSVAEADLFVQQYITGILPFSTSAGFSYSTGNVRPF